MKSNNIFWLVVLGLLALLGFGFLSRRQGTAEQPTNEFGAPLNASAGSPFGFLQPLLSPDGGKPRVTRASASGTRQGGGGAASATDISGLISGLISGARNLFRRNPTVTDSAGNVRLNSPGRAPGAIVAGPLFDAAVADFNSARTGPENAIAINHPGIPNRNFALDDPADPVFAPAGPQGGFGFGPGGFFEVGGI